MGCAGRGEDKKESKFGPIITVGIAFFLAEMGYKTQLATISLAVKYQNMLNVLIGTTIGMVIADAFGITMGVLMKKHILIFYSVFTYTINGDLMIPEAPIGINSDNTYQQYMQRV